MPSRLIRYQGVYKDIGIIQLKNNIIVEWSSLMHDGEIPLIPFGSKIEINIIYDKSDFINGSDGFVWATYDKRQVEIIKDSLLTQNIAVELEELILEDRKLFLIRVNEKRDVQNAIDFIWKSPGGLKLKPDWHYEADKENESFNRWINNI